MDEQPTSSLTLGDQPLFVEFDRRFVTVLAWLGATAAPVFFALGWILDAPPAHISGVFAAGMVAYAALQRLMGRYSALLSCLFAMACFAVISPHYPDVLRGAYSGFSLVFALFAVLLVDQRFAWWIAVAFAALWTTAALPGGLDSWYVLSMVSVVAILVFGILALNRVKEALLGFEMRHRALWENVPVGPVTSTLEGRFIDLNNAMVQMLGMTDIEDALTRPTLSFWADPADRTAIMESLSVSGAISGREVSVVRADGSSGWVRIYGSRVLDTNGRLVNQFVVEDITDEYTAREALEELLRLKDRFLASVSHELRTPLTAVVGMAAELQDRLDMLSVAEVSEFVTTIADQSSELQMLVEDLLVATRIEVTEVAITAQDVDLAQIVDRAIHQFTAMHVAVERTGNARALADPLRVRQIIRNLVSNAHRAGARHIHVDIGQVDGRASVAIIDDGPGVPAELEATIFEPYVSLNRPSGTDPLGLGLYVSRSLAERMEGGLNYLREPGRSRFILDLPSAAST